MAPETVPTIMQICKIQAINGCYNFKKGDYPISEKFYHREVSLPMFPALQEDEMNYVIEQIQKFII